jgi:hypothetical protein
VLVLITLTAVCTPAPKLYSAPFTSDAAKLTTYSPSLVESPEIMNDPESEAAVDRNVTDTGTMTTGVAPSGSVVPFLKASAGVMTTLEAGALDREYVNWYRDC